MGVSQLLGARARAAPKVYVYGWCLAFECAVEALSL